MIDFVMDDPFDNDFMDGDIELKGKEVSRKTIDGSVFVIRAVDCEVSVEQLEKLFDSLETAFNWEKQVFEEEAKKMFWSKGTITLTLREKMEGLMQNNFDIKAKYALGKSKETVSAAIFHEILEMWRDEFGLIGEGAPLMAEFLMCGDDRLLFRELCDDFGKENDSHQIGWNKVVDSFGFGKEKEKSLFEEMDSWKKSLTEEQKVGFIKENLLGWNQNRRI